MKWSLFALLVLLPAAFAADRTPAPLPAEQAAKGAVLPDGFRMTVFAAEPDLIQPVSFCIDHRGRVWVAEALNYGAQSTATADDSRPAARARANSTSIACFASSAIAAVSSFA